MRKGNSESNVEFVRRIEQARDLLDEALALMKKTKRNSSRSAATPEVRAKAHSGAIDLSMPIRAFVKKHGRGTSDLS